MGAAIAIPIAITAAGGIYSAYTQQQSGRMQSAYYGYLADTARTNAGLVSATGEANARAVGDETASEMRALNESRRQLVGTQRAALAAGGAGVGSRTGQQIIKQTLDRASLDEMALNYSAALKRKAIKNGADFEALNDLMQAQGYGVAGANSRTAARYSSMGSLLGTSGSVASQWYRYRNP